jgi:hypothetical protein
MGLDSNNIRFLLSAKVQGVDFRRMATLGRIFCLLDVDELRELVLEFGLKPDSDMFAACKTYADPFFRFLGAAEIVSIDANAYEGAAALHDMNFPIPVGLKSRFDVVLDAGTLEHVFNFPVAVKNCMEMTRVGGHFLWITPANSWCGHGFYQFSPELAFRVFSSDNGFVTERVIMTDVRPDADWFELRDPLQERQFVEFGISTPTLLLVQARKIEDCPIFTKYPEQSVYTFVWNGQYPDADRSKLIVPTGRT